MTENIGDLALESLRQAVANELEKKRRLGQYAIIVKDGIITRMIPDNTADGGWRYEPESTFAGSSN
jgi:hypothetical protein